MGRTHTRLGVASRVLRCTEESEHDPRDELSTRAGRGTHLTAECAIDLYVRVREGLLSRVDDTCVTLCDPSQV